MSEVEVAEEVYIPAKLAQDADEGNLINFELADIFGAKYMSLLDYTEPRFATHTEPSVAIGSGKESGNPLVSTTAVEQQTQS